MEPTLTQPPNPHQPYCMCGIDLDVKNRRVFKDRMEFKERGKKVCVCVRAPCHRYSTVSRSQCGQTWQRTKVRREDERGERPEMGRGREKWGPKVKPEEELVIKDSQQPS